MNPLVDGVSEVRGLSQSASAPVPGSGVFMRKGGDNGRPKSMGPEGKFQITSAFQGMDPVQLHFRMWGSSFSCHLHFRGCRWGLFLVPLLFKAL